MTDLTSGVTFVPETYSFLRMHRCANTALIIAIPPFSSDSVPPSYSNSFLATRHFTSGPISPCKIGKMSSNNSRAWPRPPQPQIKTSWTMSLILKTGLWPIVGGSRGLQGSNILFRREETRYPSIGHEARRCHKQSCNQGVPVPDPPRLLESRAWWNYPIGDL